MRSKADGNHLIYRLEPKIKNKEEKLKTKKYAKKKRSDQESVDSVLRKRIYGRPIYRKVL